MTDILEEIVAHKRIEIEQRKRFIQPRQMITLTEQKMQENGGKVMGGSMKEALVNSETGIIAEFKRKSPSKGWIKEEGKPSIIPLSYQKNGASALSILTDIDYFGGYDEYIQEARHVGVSIPILYKNFVIEEYQLLQARYCGASAADDGESLMLAAGRQVMHFDHVSTLFESVERVHECVSPQTLLDAAQRYLSPKGMRQLIYI